MVEVSDHDEPVADEKPGEAVVLDDLGGAPLQAGVLDAKDHRNDADVREDDRVALFLGEEDGVGCGTNAS